MRSSLFLAPLALLLAVPAHAQSKIIFDSKRDGNVEIYSMAPDGSAQTNLTNTPSVDEAIPGANTDVSQIAYQRTDDIWVMNADGTNQHGLNVGHIPMQAGFRPGTNLISYSRYGGYDHDIYTINPDGTGELRIVNNQWGDYYPRWSADGLKLSFYTFDEYAGNLLPDVFVCNPDGSGQVQITHTGQDQDASWSPDGGHLVFQSVRDGNKEIYLMNSDGTGVTRLTNNPAADSSPCFSPDGTKIAFSSDRDGDTEIYVMNLDGSGVTQLTFNDAPDENPTWVAPVPAGAPSVKINDVLVSEGTGSSTANFTISLSAPSATPVSVTYRTYDGTAKAGSDYVGVPGTTVTFAPGEISKIISIPILADNVYENDETFSVRLSVVGANIGDQLGVATIKANGTPPNLDIHSASIVEGNSGTSILNIPINLTSVSGAPVTVHFSTADDTAIAGQDYIAASGKVTIAAGRTSGVIPITIIGDTVLENTEGFFVNIDSPTNASRLLHTQARGTISNDDTVPGLTISDVSVAEGDTAVFTVTLSKSIGKAVTVAYATSDASAQAGSDYEATSGTVTIPGGQTTATISVPTIDDSLPENPETFNLNLSTPTNASITDPQGVATITSDDVAEVFISNVTMREGNIGARAMYFTIALSDPSPNPVTVNYTTTAGSAKAGTDFVATSGTVTIPANQLSASVPVYILGDKTYESNENFFVDLSNASGANIGQARGTGTIVNDDPAPPTALKAEEPVNPSGKGS